LPTNLPPEARAKWAKYLEARTPEEKLRALEEYMSTIPKHKGTENLRAWVRRKMAELKEEVEERKARRSGTGGPTFFIEKSGAAQIIMLGFPNSGKSSLLKALTNAKPEVSSVPFTTKFPVPGMVTYEDIQFQLIEAPSIIEGVSKGAIWWGSRVLGLARNADALMITVDSSQNPLQQLKTIVNELQDVGIHLIRPRGEVRITKSKAIHGIKVITYGKLVGCTADDIRKLLEEYKIYNAEVKIVGQVTLEDVERAIFERITYKPSLIILTKIDLLKKPEIPSLVKEIRRHLSGVPVIPTSTVTGEGLSKIPKTLFEVSEIIRVYTKTSF